MKIFKWLMVSCSGTLSIREYNDADNDVDNTKIMFEDTGRYQSILIK